MGAILNPIDTIPSIRRIGFLNPVNLVNPLEFELLTRLKSRPLSLMKLFASFANWRARTFSALTRFPWNILCGATGAVCAIIALHSEGNQKLTGQCARLIMTAAVGMPLFFSLRMLRERSERLRRWPIEIFGLPLLAGWFFAQPANPVDGPTIVIVRWLLLVAAMHFIAAVSAYVRGVEGLGFWQFNRRLFLRFCLAALYAGVLTAGLELALFSANKLFTLGIDKAYAYLFFIMAGIFHPAFFLGGVPSHFESLDTDSDYPRGLKAFTQFALAPLVAVYTALLCIYTVKILISRTWPHGWVAFPVLLLSGIGILAFLLLFPLRDREGERWATWFTRNFPRALAPLSILLLLSLRVRIADYGVTEERYLGVVSGFWILGWAITFILRQNSGIRWIPYSLALICILAAFGPWSAGAVSKASQLGRITQLLQTNGLWKDGKATPFQTLSSLPSKVNSDLHSTLAYLLRTHGALAIQKIFEPLSIQIDWKNVTSSVATREIIAALNISNRVVQNGAIYAKRIPNASIDVQGFQKVWHLNYWNLISPTKDSPFNQHQDVRLHLEQGLLSVATDQQTLPQEIPLDGLYTQLNAKRATELPDQDLTIDLNHGTRTFRIIFDSLSLYQENEQSRVQNCDLYLLER